MTATALCSAMPLADQSVPEWVHLLPAGEVRTIDGRGPYRVRDAAAVIATSIAAGKLPLDENHATDLAAPKGGPAPARGWIVALQQRSDGLWGRVEWTPIGRRIMADRAYRGVSPVIAHRPDGTISAVLRASLTNTPNLAGLTALHSQGLPGLAHGAIVAPGGLSSDETDIARRLGLDTASYAAALRPVDPGDGLDAADLDMIARLGIDRAAYAATRHGRADP